LFFEEPVPREVFGEPIETWLRAIPRGRYRNSATRGRAVRPLALADLQRILELGGAPLLAETTYPLAGDLPHPEIAARERLLTLVNVLKRSADFRRRVIGAYGERCAVSGFSLGHIAVSKAVNLLDAAHIRPVSYDGSDAITNGIPLTPTLHRLFDAGLFTIEYREALPVVRVSPRLEPSMITSDSGGSRLDLRDGLKLRVPGDHRAWPNPVQLRFHQERVFQSG
jgi:putative restriction endonuclease